MLHILFYVLLGIVLLYKNKLIKEWEENNALAR